jgi:hypothetical protein
MRQAYQGLIRFNSRYHKVPSSNRHRSPKLAMKISPARPKISNTRANWWLDWLETAAYTFWVVFTIAIAILLLIHGVSATGLLRVIR